MARFVPEFHLKGDMYRFIGINPLMYKEITVSQNEVRQKVLIIEVEPEMKIFLSNLLVNDGFEPIVFDGDREELNRLKKADPSLIILDAMMPKAESIQIYHNIKHDEKLRTVPIIILSNIDRKTFFRYLKVQNSRFGQGVPEPNAYLEKPPETENLLGIVRILTTRV